MEKQNNLNPVICKVLFAELSIIDSIITSSDNTSVVINYVTNEDAEDIYFTPGTAEPSNSYQSVSEGNLYNNSLQLKYPGDGITMPGILIQINGKRGIVIYTYNNGVIKTFGSKENPVVVSMSFEPSQGGYNISFTQSDVNPPLNV